MKYHVATQSGKWVGGFIVRKYQLAEHLKEMRFYASHWGQPLVATRLDGKRKGDTILILPMEAPAHDP